MNDNVTFYIFNLHFMQHCNKTLCFFLGVPVFMNVIRDVILSVYESINFKTRRQYFKA